MLFGVLFHQHLFFCPLVAEVAVGAVLETVMMAAPAVVMTTLAVVGMVVMAAVVVVMLVTGVVAMTLAAAVLELVVGGSRVVRWVVGGSRVMRWVGGGRRVVVMWHDVGARIPLVHPAPVHPLSLQGQK
jgi:hypothetical protein